MQEALGPGSGAWLEEVWLVLAQRALEEHSSQGVLVQLAPMAEGPQGEQDWLWGSLEVSLT